MKIEVITTKPDLYVVVIPYNTFFEITTSYEPKFIGCTAYRFYGGFCIFGDNSCVVVGAHKNTDDVEDVFRETMALEIYGIPYPKDTKIQFTIE